MKKTYYMRLSCLCLLLLLFSTAHAQQADTSITTVILVRHAEKAADGTPDPPLTAKGEETAQDLATLLEHSPVDAVFSTDYQRTRSTAQPLAEQKGLEVQLYDPRQQGQWLQQMLQQYAGKTILVVGHSNTVPAAINQLLQENKLQALDESAYGQVFVLSLVSDGSRHLLPLQLDL